MREWERGGEWEWSGEGNKLEKQQNHREKDFELNFSLKKNIFFLWLLFCVGGNASKWNGPDDRWVDWLSLGVGGGVRQWVRERESEWVSRWLLGVSVKWSECFKEQKRKTKCCAYKDVRVKRSRNSIRICCKLSPTSPLVSLTSFDWKGSYSVWKKNMSVRV